MQHFQHQAHGLNIQSDFELSGLVEAEFAQPDVLVRFGSVQPHLEAHRQGKLMRYRGWEASKSHFLLELDHIAKYLVTGGDHILVEKHPGASLRDVMAFFTGSALTALLQQRQLFTLHASAVQTAQGAVLFMGKSGAGKSTLCRAMQKRGFPMISDDVSAITFDEDGSATMLPSSPTTRLWGDSIDGLGEQRGAHRKLRTELDKFLVPAESFCNQPQPIHKIFSLTTHNRQTIDIQPLPSADSFQALSLFTFRKNFYLGQELGRLYFESVTRLARSVEVAAIARPTQPFLINELAEAVCRHIAPPPSLASPPPVAAARGTA